MSSDKGNKKEKNQNIQVFVRLRPINSRERELKSLGVVEVSGSKDVTVKMTPLDGKLTKKFSFDRAFGPNSKQVEVYQEVVSPLIEEVLSGYNCTVFAYGQTGTGKTHTMVGESSSNGDVPWQNDPMAGIIPRALSQLFDELRITNTEFTVRVSYLELYNEELFDLLSSSEDNSKLRIYEDVTRKGSNIVNGLEEVTVYNKNEVYKIMAKGQEKRKIASTLMNAQSSRSHTVFTIVVHMKECSPEGEELMKIGKLNLVDLAGSENISKAGSDNPARKERARECVNINQSLLTLGRVITALVERHPHIPYRESKLTRLLQESLGGRTKTSIIATISPGHRDVEETLSTLDYAYRARCIQNKPEVNQRITKHAVLKEFSEEIDRLKRDLQASREKNGVYLSMDSYSDINMKLEEQSKEIQDQILHIKAIKEEKDKMEELFNQMSENFKRKEEQLVRTSSALENAKQVINVTKKDLAETRMECDEQKELVSKRQATELILSEQAHKLLRVADASTSDVHHLHNTVEKKKALECGNLEKVKGFGEKSQSQRMQMKEQLNTFNREQSQQLSVLQEALDKQINNLVQYQHTEKKSVNDMLQKITDAIIQSSCSKEESINKYNEYSENKLNELRMGTEQHKQALEGKLHEVLEIALQVQSERDKQMNSAVQMMQFVQQWKDMFNIKMQSMHRMQEVWWQQFTHNMESFVTNYEEQHNATLKDMRRMTEERGNYQEDIFNSFKQLRQMLDDLEAKSQSSASRLSTEEKNACTSLEARGKAFADTLTNGRNTLELANEGMKAATQEVETSHSGFIKDICEMNEDHTSKIQKTRSMEGQLTDKLSALPRICSEEWLQFGTQTSEIHTETLHRIVDTIGVQQAQHASVLKECHVDGCSIIPHMNSVVEELNQFDKNNRTSIKQLNETLGAYADATSQQLSITDTIESRFLNEEYKLYSPTGKTPVRREFSFPRDLAATSPHERILRRFRRMRDGAESPQNRSVIDLDQTTEEPSNPTIDVTNQSSEISSPEHESTVANLSSVEGVGANTSSQQSQEDSIKFAEPRKLPPRATLKTSPTTMIKSTSDSDIYSLVNADSSSKENLNQTSTEKRDTKSRLRQPMQKRVLANRNY